MHFLPRFIIGIVICLVIIAFSPIAIAADPWKDPLENVYWGDLHVHTMFSLDAWVMFMAPGNLVDEAGQYAAHCARLDFYSCTDHAEALTRNDYWDESIRAAQYFNQYGRDNPAPDGDPSIIAFTGWEWTQQAPWGHKNIIMKYDDPAKLPPSMIRCYKGVLGLRPQDWFDNQNLTFLAETPERLFTLLEEYCTAAGTGCEAVVIPHGNAWGQMTMNTDWDQQANSKNHSPELQRLIEVYSKHGNSEEYRYFPPDYRYYLSGREVEETDCRGGEDCEKVCQEPTDVYEPCCFRAGEITRERCADPDSQWCKKQVELAKLAVQPFPDGVPVKDRDRIKKEYRRDPQKVEYRDWRACGQCLDCYQPTFNHNPTGSVQYALTRAWFDERGNPSYYRFGFVNSTDTHQARPGSVMETKKQSELSIAYGGGALYRASKATRINIAGMGATVPMYGFERIANYMNPGGFLAILAEHRTRDDLFEALRDRRVYGTSGGRIELWLRAEVKERGLDKVVRMGDETSSSNNPVFHIKANGAFKEDGTCRYDEHPEIREAMSKSEFDRVCYSQCYSPLDERMPIDRIEVVKIRQPLTRAEAEMENLTWSRANPGGLIMDPYATVELGEAQVEWSWKDEGFEREDPGRSVAYYFRVIQEATPGYNCRPTARLTRAQSCDSRMARPDYVDKKANPQDGSKPISRDRLGDPCYSDPGDVETFCEERAWSSPVYIIRE
jgi:hypothetical protein